MTKNIIEELVERHTFRVHRPEPKQEPTDLAVEPSPETTGTHPSADDSISKTKSNHSKIQQ